MTYNEIASLESRKCRGSVNGIIYSATGDKFFDEALVSARSSTRFNQVPHMIFTNCERSAPDDGIAVRLQAPTGNPYADKIRSILATPFERTIFLDTDTYVIDELLDLFALLDRYDLAAAHTPGYRGHDDPEVPVAFYELNTGLLVYRQNEAVSALLADWLETYERWCAEPPFKHAGTTTGYADQPSFRNCVWRSEVSLYVLGHEYCFRTLQCGQVADRVRAIHGRHNNFERVAEILNRERRARVFPRGTFLGM